MTGDQEEKEINETLKMIAELDDSKDEQIKALILEKDTLILERDALILEKNTFNLKMEIKDKEHKREMDDLRAALMLDGERTDTEKGQAKEKDGRLREGIKRKYEDTIAEPKQAASNTGDGPVAKKPKAPDASTENVATSEWTDDRFCKVLDIDKKIFGNLGLKFHNLAKAAIHFTTGNRYGSYVGVSERVWLPRIVGGYEGTTEEKKQALTALLREKLYEQDHQRTSNLYGPLPRNSFGLLKLHVQYKSGLPDRFRFLEDDGKQYKLLGVFLVCDGHDQIIKDYEFMKINPPKVKDILYSESSLVLKVTARDGEEQPWVSIFVEFAKFNGLALFVKVFKAGWERRVQVLECPSLSYPKPLQNVVAKLHTK